MLKVLERFGAGQHGGGRGLPPGALPGQPGAAP